MSDLENLIMAHRYLYYVKGTPELTDPEYDLFEEIVRHIVPRSSPINSVGSDLESSYSDKVKSIAEGLARDGGLFHI